MSKFGFKCAENPEHVKEANLTQQDVLDALNFFVHFNLELDFSAEEYEAEAEKRKNDPASLHDLAHQLTDNIVRIYDTQKDTALHDEMFTNIIVELRQKQEECRGGHKHD